MDALALMVCALWLITASALALVVYALLLRPDMDRSVDRDDDVNPAVVFLGALLLTGIPAAGAQVAGWLS